MAKENYVGVAVTGNNLVVNGDFSNGVSGWYYDDVNSYGALQLSANDNVLTINLVKSNTSNNIIKSETNINTVAGHVYYAKLEAKSNSSNDFRFYATLAGSPNISTNDLVKDNEWHILSLRGVTGEYSYPFMISCYQPDKNNTVECRNIAVYDLTAMFGTGNEPTQEWCDNNLDAVKGKGVARKVKKAYVGVAEDSLIVNGDFSNGTRGWSHSDETNTNITYTVEDNWLVATCNTSYSDNTSFDVLSQLTNWQTNHQYYLRYTGKVLNYVENANASTTLGIHFSSGNIQSNLDLSKLNEEQTISRISTWTSDTMDRKTTTALRKVEAGTKVAFTGIRTFDLTAMYGAGNEPTKEWCDNNLETLKTLYKSKNSKARKIKKGYIGVGGVARLFYSAPIQFTSNPAPTTWTLGSNETATASNEYGEWSISSRGDSGALGGYSTTDEVYNAFDGNARTYFRTYDAVTSYVYLTLTLPTGISINPETIYIKYSYFGDTRKIQGYNTSTSTWEDISELSTKSTSATEQTLSITTNAYYSAFRVAANPYSTSSGYRNVRLFEFQITSGTFKIE